MNDLTDNEQRVLDYLKSCIELRGFPPTRAEISRALESPSPAAAQWWLTKLEEKGYIQMDPGVARGIRVIDRED